MSEKTWRERADEHFKHFVAPKQTEEAFVAEQVEARCKECGGLTDSFGLSVHDSLESGFKPLR
jgi:hypothetical protein